MDVIRLPETAGLHQEGAEAKEHALLLHVSFNFVAACIGSIAKKISCVIMVSSRRFCRVGFTVCVREWAAGRRTDKIMYEEEIR